MFTYVISKYLKDSTQDYTRLQLLGKKILNTELADLEANNLTSEKKIKKKRLKLNLVLQCSEVAQLCPTLCDPMDCSPPRPSIHGMFQARILK